MHPDTSPEREATEEACRQRRLAGTLVAAAYDDHYDRHDGPIMFCDAATCRAAWAAVNRAA